MEDLYRGRHVQLVATGPNGPRPVAERWVGKIPQHEPVQGGSQSPEAWLMQIRRATGARIVVTLIHEMRRRDSRRGLATLCMSGGMGMAIGLER